MTSLPLARVFQGCLHFSRSYSLRADRWKSDSSVDGEPQGNWRQNSNSREAVASSPSFYRPAARAPRRACSQVRPVRTYHRPPSLQVRQTLQQDPCAEACVREQRAKATTAATKTSKSNRFRLAKLQLCTCNPLFVHFFAVTARVRRERSLFYVLLEDMNLHVLLFLFLNVDRAWYNLIPEKFANI